MTNILGYYRANLVGIVSEEPDVVCDISGHTGTGGFILEVIERADIQQNHEGQSYGGPQVSSYCPLTFADLAHLVQTQNIGKTVGFNVAGGVYCRLSNKEISVLEGICNAHNIIVLMRRFTARICLGDRIPV